MRCPAVARAQLLLCPEQCNQMAGSSHLHDLVAVSSAVVMMAQQCLNRAAVLPIVLGHHGTTIPGHQLVIVDVLALAAPLEA